MGIVDVYMGDGMDEGKRGDRGRTWKEGGSGHRGGNWGKEGRV